MYGSHFIVLDLLVATEDGPGLALLTTRDLPCECGTALTWYVPGRTWMCPRLVCSRSYLGESIVARIREIEEEYVRRWRVQLNLSEEQRPTGQEFDTAAAAGDWDCARKLSRIALQKQCGMPMGERGDWLDRFSVAYRSVGSGLSGL